MSQSDRAFSPSSDHASTAVIAAGGRDVLPARPRVRAEVMDRTSLAPADEILVVDERSELRPAQVVESKLTRMLKDASLPASHLQMQALLRRR